MSYANLDGRLPIVLLPVRLETRYFASGSALELRIRIYPDAVHVAPPPFTATADEVALAQSYWRAHHAGDPQAAALRSRLETAAGDARARAVLRHSEPTVAAGNLVFPDVPTRDDDDATSRVLALPERFDVVGFAGTTRVFTVTGADIAPELHVSPLGSMDPESRWQSDFAIAKRSGLGVVVPLDHASAAQLTRIVVVGIRGTESSDVSAGVLEDLLERHATHHGASFLAVGTPTNHTPGTKPGGVPPPAPEAALPAGSDGDRVATALGIATATFVTARGAASFSDAGARAMMAATWPATWGYFLEQVLAPAVPAATIAEAQRFYLAHVRARGPFPTLTLGRQPYGVLPVTSLARWRSSDDRFAAIMRALLPRWIASGRLAPALVGASDPHAALVDIHAIEPTSARWLVRSLADVHVAGRWWLDDRIDIPDPIALEVRAELARAGITGVTRATNLVFGDAAHDIDLPLVAARRRPGFPGGGTGYIRAIAQVANARDLVEHRIDGASPRTLLYYLLRHATLLMFQHGALVATSAVARVDEPIRETPSARFGDLLGRTLPEHGERELGEVMARRVPDVSIFSPLRAHRAAVAALAELPTGELHRLTAETLDLASHRLDAWITGIATQRLVEQRQAHREGAGLGAYGWIDAPPVPAMPATEGAVLPPPAGNHGFVIAPSLEHARTAAVLRAGFVASSGPDLAIDLSSRRVRAAREVLDGIRGGRSLGALLGLRIERALVERNLGEHIETLRGEHRLASGGLDGLAVHDAWHTTAPAAELAPIARELAELVDAISDLLLAELVHQNVVGNTSRAAAVLDTIETGTSPPPDPDVVRTSSSAERVSWRLVWSALPPVGSAMWPSAATSARALAQPALERGAAAVLGRPIGADALVRGTRSDGAIVERRVTLDELELGALDLVTVARRDFAGSPLARLFERVLGDGLTQVTCTPNAPLRAVCLIASALRDCLASARPLVDVPTSTELAEWQSRIAQALQQLDADLASTDPRARAHLAAIGNDVTALREQLATMTPAAAIALLTGVPPETGTAWLHASVPEWADATARSAWLADRARVRPIFDALDLVDVGARSRGAPLPLAAFATTREQRTVIVGPTGATQSGWIIDTWLETTPRADVTAAIAMHVDQPNARAAQAILLAVPPDLSAAWSLDTLLDTIAETIDLTFARQAAPHEVWGPLLPAVYLADALDQDTPSTPLGDHAVVLDFEVTP